MKHIKRTLWFIAALVFLFEAWLWDTLYPIVARLIDWLPWTKLKAWVADRIRHLPPAICVGIFIIPALLILPFKIIGLWLLSQGYVMMGVTVFLAAKLVGLGAAAFIFETCKDKLLQLRWFMWVYKTVLKIKAWAMLQTEPARRQLRKIKVMMLGERGQVIALLKRLRQRILARVGKV